MFSHVSRKYSNEVLPRASSEDHVDHKKSPRQIESLHRKESHHADIGSREVPAPDVQEHEHERAVQNDEAKTRQRKRNALWKRA